VLTTEGRVTFIDGLLAVRVLVGLSLNATAGWWWADPLAGLVIVFSRQGGPIDPREDRVTQSSGLTIGSGRREPARERRELGVR